jgi:hypothetical protein
MSEVYANPSGSSVLLGGMLVTTSRPSPRGRPGRPRRWSVCGGEHRRSSCYRRTSRSKQCRRTVWCAPLLLCNQARTCSCSSVAATTDAWPGTSSSRWLPSRSTASPENTGCRMNSLRSQVRALLAVKFWPYFLRSVVRHQPQISSTNPQFATCIQFFQPQLLCIHGFEFMCIQKATGVFRIKRCTFARDGAVVTSRTSFIAPRIQTAVLPTAMHFADVTLEVGEVLLYRRTPYRMIQSSSTVLWGVDGKVI